MTAYLLQTLLFQLLFLLAFETLLKKETFFASNRAYLLLTAVASLLLPFAKIEALDLLSAEENFTAISHLWLPEILLGTNPETIQVLPAVELQSGSTPINWWLLAYGAGFMASLLILIRKFIHLRKLFKYPSSSRQKNFRIIEIPNSTLACSFYKTIFLGAELSEPEREQILPHELVHVKQKHSLDLLFFELLKLIFWFNPLIYVYQRRISNLHEFQADAAVVKQAHKPKYYQHLLNHAFHTQHISFINQFFNHSLIKKRILMLQKTRSHALAQLKFLVLLPLLLGMLSLVSCSTEGEQSADPAETVSEQLDALQLSLEQGQQFSTEDYEKLAKIARMVAKDQGNTRSAQQVTPGDSPAVPFTLVESPPVFADCPESSSAETNRDCFINTISNFVAEEFDTAIGDKVGEKGMNKIYVQFTIDKQGQVVNVRARGPHPQLEAEGIRVVENLPRIIPASHAGKPVSVIYSLPIAFNVK